MHEAIEQFVEELASADPTPGGGAAAALEAALGAALISMVCNLTIGKERYRDHEATMTKALAEADALRVEALALADEDATAFAAVSAAYKLPKATDEERAVRSRAIQAALREATDAPLRTTRLALRVLQLSDGILEGANPNVLSDVGVAAHCARAALGGAALNVRVNLKLSSDRTFATTAGGDLDSLLRSGWALADKVADAVERRISS